MSKSIDFFETQFRQQVDGGELPLNPFETRALPHLRGRVLDFGCGLGNLAVAAARQGCRVLALDGAPTAVEHLKQRAAAESLPIEAAVADLRDYPIDGDFDAVVCIGLLMFFDCAAARRQLARLQACVRPGGVVVVNVLIEGTTFRAMFDPDGHCLFGRTELVRAFAGWEIIDQAWEDFPAPGDTRKAFATLVARRPASP
ncbi:MAG: methyltransferase domain-containing protein [Sterolibacteriaceae bacterium MAG5]|nr:methyltransferase domain-containing protein [Candidatus Nitricoxidireducens bremensis]